MIFGEVDDALTALAEPAEKLHAPEPLWISGSERSEGCHVGILAPARASAKTTRG